MRAFVEACPPFDISRIENARQFYGFLTARWERRPPAPPYLPDVAACELACAQARIEADSGSEVEIDSCAGSLPAIRRKPGVILLRTASISGQFSKSGRRSVDPTERDVRLAIAFSCGRAADLRTHAGDIRSACRARRMASRLASWRSAEGLIAELAEAGVLEVRR